MTSAKAQLYSTSLDLARRLDLCASLHPVDAHGKVNRGTGPSPDGMDWKELVRKFTKHNPGREVTAQAALTEHTLHLLLLKSAQSSHYHPSTSHRSDVPSISPSTPPKIAWPPLVLPSDRSTLLVELEALDVLISSGSGSEGERNSAKVIWATGIYAVGDFEKSLEKVGEVRKEVPEDGSGERYGFTLRVLASLVEGEHLLSASIGQGRREEGMVLISLGGAGKVYNDVCDILTKSGGTKDDLALHVVGEDALYRSAFWSRSSSDSSAALIPHRLYLRHSTRWSSSFRPTKTLLIHRSLRSLLHEIGPSRSNPQTWHAEVSENNKAQEAILRRTTSLPSAGDVNLPYLRFLDDVAEGWRIGGSGREGAGEVIEIMYNALTHTFQSQRLLRHLMFALTSKGSYVEAGKALKIYVELFDKARETDAAQVARDVRKFRAKADAATMPVEKIEEKPVQVEVDEDEEEFDIDSDREFVRTLTFGARVSCKYLDDPEKGLKLAERAREIFDEGKDRSLSEDRKEESQIERALGVALGALTAKEADPLTRPARHTLALTHLENAAVLDPNSWETLYHLSYQLAELRQINPALEKARAAVKLNGTSRDCWHLLGLLVGAQKDLGASLQVLETGLDEDTSRADLSDEDGVRGELREDGLPMQVVGAKVNGSGNGNGNGDMPFLAPVVRGNQESVALNGSSHEVENNGNGNGVDGSLLESKLERLPTKSSPSDRLPRDETEILVSEIQIRMTKNVVIEAMEGPEAALLDQQALLAYFSAAYADIRQQPEVTAGPDIVVPSSTLGSSTSTKRSHSILGRRRSTRLSTGPAGDMLGSSLRAPQSTLSVASARSANHTPSLSLTASVVSLDAATQSGTGSSTGPTVETNPRATKLLVDLWLMTAASFRRAGRLDDSRGAIQEAESLDADDADVWVQFALYNIAVGAVDEARISLIKALAFDLSHIAATVLLARLYLASPKQLPYAEGTLETLTQRQGWDVPEAWFELSRCFKGTGRAGREKECLVKALGLEETKGVRPLSCLPRLL
ncbi:cargo-transport protein YPP1, partial [Phenoliferia sp. Uapishka_3]